MERLLTPRELAEAMGVSESSLKRWADGGKLRAWRTEGGHRRFQLRDAIQFVRDRRAPLVRPDILGLTEPTTDDAFVAAALDGDTDAARAALMARFAAGESIAALCDGPLRTALAQVGDLWKHDPDGVFVEHRTTALCTEVLASLRAILPPATGRTAIGGAAPGDPYTIPSMMTAITLIDRGFRAANLGADTPVDTLMRAAASSEVRPALVWLAVMTPPATATIAAVAELGIELGRREIPLVLGGRWAEAIPTPGASSIRRASSMVELASIVATL